MTVYDFILMLFKLKATRQYETSVNHYLLDSLKVSQEAEDASCLHIVLKTIESDLNECALCGFLKSYLLLSLL